LSVSLPAWFTLAALESCGSTNDEAKERARAGAPEGTLVWARAQTAGRGRRGRSWESAGGNLYCSLIVRPAADSAAAAQLSFVTALAVAEAVSAQIAAAPRLKWPNDVLVDGAKIAGILLEAEPGHAGQPDWLVVGTGINVRTHPDGLDRSTTDLVACGAAGASVEGTLSLYAAHFQAWYQRWQRQGFAPVRAAWLNAAYGVGEPVRLSGQPPLGRFVDLDLDGALLVEGAAGRQRITAGDVVFGQGT
jgi:BirA family biotin operon repressor/biotin-[acetyl-CoA-carboxylase] ligase